MEDHVFTTNPATSKPRFAFKRPQFNKKIIKSLVVIVLVATTAFVTFRIGSTVLNRSRASDEVKMDEALITKAKEKGSVKVIIRMAVDSTPYAQLDDQKKNEKKEKIKKLQDDTEEAIKGPKTKVSRKFEIFPLMSAEVDEIALSKLKALKGTVSAVTEDKVVYANLDTSSAEVHAPEAYNAGLDGTGSVVAIVDTGVEKNHEFLKKPDGTSKVIAEACFTDNGSCPGSINEVIGTDAAGPCGWNDSNSADQFDSTCEHGTHVAGIAAGGTSINSSPIIHGIAKGANIIAVNIANKYTDPGTCTDPDHPNCTSMSSSAMIRSLEWILQNKDTTGVDVVNFSLGFGMYSAPCTDEAFQEAINQMNAANIPIVSAAGNDDFTNAIRYPACLPGMIVAGAYAPPSTMIENASTNFANFLIAPGYQIASSGLNNSYVAATGTSMAAPHVTGAIAILRQLDPNATVQDIINALKLNAEIVHDSRQDAPANADYPKLNVFQALQNLSGSTPNGVVNTSYSNTDSTQQIWNHNGGTTLGVSDEQ